MISRYFIFRALLTVCFSLVALLGGCAHTGTPGGGPEDLTPPQLDTVTPAPGSVMVSPTTAISFEFSEWIDPRTVEPALSLFPPVDGGTRTRISGRTVTITPKNALADSTTYHLEVGAGLSDLRRNPLGTPFRLVFSTGSKLDSGSVSGCVIDSRLAVLQPKVALFAHTGSSTDDTLWFALPDYIAQTDSGGQFRFDNVRKGTYRICAFMDKNNDNRFQPAREEVYAPRTPVITVDKQTPPLTLFAVSCDTSTFAVKSIRPLSATLIAGTFNRVAQSKADSSATEFFHIESIDSLREVIKIDTVVTIGSGERFLLRLSDSLGLSGYRLVYRRIALFGPDSGFNAVDTIRFNGITLRDTIAPRLLRATPGVSAGLEPRMALTFDKPVLFSDAGALLVDSLQDTILVPAQTHVYSDTLVFGPVARLAPGSKYQAHFLRSAIKDLSGNAAVDTTDTTGFLSLSFSTIAADNICDALAADSGCLAFDPARQWLFTPSKGGERVIAPQTQNGGFLFEALPAGKGTLAWFLDHNGDKEPTRGRLIPWFPPEEYVPYYDTLEARARWEVTGLVAPGCELCQRGQLTAARATLPSGKKQSSPQPPRATVPRPTIPAF